MLAVRTAQKPRVKVQHVGIAVSDAGPRLYQIARFDDERNWCDMCQLEQIGKPWLSRPQRRYENQPRHFHASLAYDPPENREWGKGIGQQIGPRHGQRVYRPCPWVGDWRHVHREAMIELGGEQIYHRLKSPELERT